MTSSQEIHPSSIHLIFIARQKSILRMGKICCIRELLITAGQTPQCSWEGKEGRKNRNSSGLLLLSSSDILSEEGLKLSEMRGGAEDYVEQWRMGWDSWRGYGSHVGAESLKQPRRKECVFRGGERDVPGWVGGDEGACKSDNKACLLWGGKAGKSFGILVSSM